MQEAISEGIFAVSEGRWNRFPYDGCCWISHQVDSHSNQVLNCVSNYMAKKFGYRRAKGNKFQESATLNLLNNFCVESFTFHIFISY